MALTAKQKKAGNNLLELAKFNVTSTADQYYRAKQNYDQADAQNRALAEEEKDQNSAKSAGERFAQAKKLQAATRGVLSAAGNGLQGSGAGNLMDMLRTRTDLDTGETLGTLATNQNAVANALTEALNANVLARNEAASNAEFGIRGVEADTAAQRNNIDPSLFKKPGTGGIDLGGTGFASRNVTRPNTPTPAGYILPPTSGRPSKRSGVTGNTYFDRLLASYGRS